MKAERIKALRSEAEIALRRDQLLWAVGMIELIDEIERKKTIPDSAVCFFKDGNSWACVNGDFVNLQESPAGFGDTFEEALDSLRDQLPHQFVPSGRPSDKTCAKCDGELENPIHNAEVARYCDDSGI